MDRSINLESKIKGWGADLDPKNRPAVPMEKTPPEGTGAHWDEPERQIPKTKIYHSIERPGITPVFGTSCPPVGLSRRVRDVAYRFSEAQLSHWLLLMLADRINVIEGVLHDLAHLRVPNPFAEMGLKSELKYNRKNFQRKALIAGGAVIALGGLVALLRRRRHARA